MFRKIFVLWGVLVLFLLFPLALKAHIIQLAPCDFMPKDVDEGNWYISGDNNALFAESGASIREVFCNLDLPHLSMMDQLRIYYLDNHSGSIRVRLMREKVSDGTEITMADWTSSGTSTARQVMDIDVFSYPTIKSKGYRYFLWIVYSDINAGNQVKLYGIRVRYFGGV